MKPETFKALKDSIRHWKRMQKMTLRQRVAEGNKEEPSGPNCALCARFYFNGDFGLHCRLIEGGAVEECPVAEKTGMIGCNGSPWWDAFNAFYFTSSKAWKKKAQAEIDFLESLLPKKEGAK